jgi:hypothetical protein
MKLSEQYNYTKRTKHFPKTIRTWMVLHTTNVKGKNKTKKNMRKTLSVRNITCKKELSNR